MEGRGERRGEAEEAAGAEGSDGWGGLGGAVCGGYGVDYGVGVVDASAGEL